MLMLQQDASCSPAGQGTQAGDAAQRREGHVKRRGVRGGRSANWSSTLLGMLKKGELFPYSALGAAEVSQRLAESIEALPWGLLPCTSSSLVDAKLT